MAISPNIKHLVISSSGPNIITMYGVLSELEKNGLWSLENIESFHVSSAGSLLAVLTMIKTSWDDIDNYIIERPWEKIWNIDHKRFFTAFTNKGLFNMSDFYKLLEPFFLANDIKKTITLKEFYEITKKELNIYISELNTFKSSCLNYQTNPTTSLLEALYMSCAVPIFFEPLIKNNNCYLDGGLFNYFPVRDLIKKVDNNTILGICNDRYEKQINTMNISETSNILEYISRLLNNVLNFTIHASFAEIKLKYIVFVPGFDSSSLWMSIIISKEKRKEMLELGKKTGKNYFSEVSRATTPPNAP